MTRKSLGEDEDDVDGPPVSLPAANISRTSRTIPATPRASAVVLVCLEEGLAEPNPDEYKTRRRQRGKLQPAGDNSVKAKDRIVLHSECYTANACIFNNLNQGNKGIAELCPPFAA